MNSTETSGSVIKRDLTTSFELFFQEPKPMQQKMLHYRHFIALGGMDLFLSQTKQNLRDPKVGHLALTLSILSFFSFEI